YVGQRTYSIEEFYFTFWPCIFQRTTHCTNCWEKGRTHCSRTRRKSEPTRCILFKSFVRLAICGCSLCESSIEWDRNNTTSRCVKVTMLSSIYLDDICSSSAYIIYIII